MAANRITHIKMAEQISILMIEVLILTMADQVTAHQGIAKKAGAKIA
jgi:hypothetical protein